MLLNGTALRCVYMMRTLFGSGEVMETVPGLRIAGADAWQAFSELSIRLREVG
jgi:hypothetical protein